jgi:hypothetical protein
MTSSTMEHELYIHETPAECFERRRKWRLEGLKDAQRQIARARAYVLGKKRLGVVPVYAQDASEAEIQEAIRRINLASWEHKNA